MRLKYVVRYSSGRTETKFFTGSKEAKLFEDGLKKLSTVTGYDKTEIKK